MPTFEARNLMRKLALLIVIVAASVGCYGHRYGRGGYGGPGYGPPAYGPPGYGPGYYGMAGCGLGSMIFGPVNEPVAQVLAATTNGTLATQTFGISSGTSNCVSGGVIRAEREQAAFAEVNFDDLKRDMAAGGGEYLRSFSSLLGCGVGQAGPVQNDAGAIRHDPPFREGGPDATWWWPPRPRSGPIPVSLAPAATSVPSRGSGALPDEQAARHRRWLQAVRWRPRADGGGGPLGPPRFRPLRRATRRHATAAQLAESLVATVSVREWASSWRRAARKALRIAT